MTARTGITVRDEFHLDLAFALMAVAGVLAALFIGDTHAAIRFAMTLVIVALAKGAYVTPIDHDR